MDAELNINVLCIYSICLFGKGEDSAVSGLCHSQTNDTFLVKT